MSNLESKWWFVATVSGVSAFAARFVLEMAGIPSPSGWAQWTLFFFCLLGFWRCLSFLAWSALLLIAPTNPLLDKPGARPPRRAS